MATSTQGFAQTIASDALQKGSGQTQANPASIQARLIDYGYACRDGVWYKVFKAETPNSDSQKLRPAERGYICQNGVWYKRVGLEEQPLAKK